MANLQHPAITACERYGYPEEPKATHQCSECDDPIYAGDECYHLTWGWVCKTCMDRAYTEAD